MRWGLFGAAGVVFVVREGSSARVMLQRRSMFAHEGGTWSCAGGALHEGEDPIDGARREAAEEVGELPAEQRVIGQFAFTPADDWSYVTAVIEVDAPFGVSNSFETDAIEWVPLDEVERRPLHAGFTAAWPHLRHIIEEAPT